MASGRCRWAANSVVAGLVSIPLLAGCSVGDDSPKDNSSISSLSATEVDSEYEHAFTDIVKLSGIPENKWKWQSGLIFDASDLRQEVPHMSAYCGKDEKDRDMFNKDAGLELSHPNTTQEYKNISEKVWKMWESQGLEPYAVGGTSDSEEIAVTTKTGTLIQFVAGEGGMMIFADSACGTSPAPQDWYGPTSPHTPGK